MSLFENDPQIFTNDEFINIIIFIQFVEFKNEKQKYFWTKFKTSFLRLQGWICPKSKHFVGPENTKLKIGLFKTSKEPWFWRKVCECYVFNRIVSWSISLFTTFFQIYIFSATFSALVIPGTEIWIVTLSTLLECHETNNLWR